MKPQYTPWYVVVDDKGLPATVHITRDMAHDHIKYLQLEFEPDDPIQKDIAHYTVVEVVPV